MGKTDTNATLLALLQKLGVDRNEDGWAEKTVILLKQMGYVYSASTIRGWAGLRGISKDMKIAFKISDADKAKGKNLPHGAAQDRASIGQSEGTTTKDTTSGPDHAKTLLNAPGKEMGPSEPTTEREARVAAEREAKAYRQAHLDLAHEVGQSCKQMTEFIKQLLPPPKDSLRADLESAREQGSKESAVPKSDLQKKS